MAFWMPRSTDMKPSGVSGSGCAPDARSTSTDGPGRRVRTATTPPSVVGAGTGGRPWGRSAERDGLRVAAAVNMRVVAARPGDAAAAVRTPVSPPPEWPIAAVDGRTDQQVLGRDLLDVGQSGLARPVACAVVPSPPRATLQRYPRIDTTGMGLSRAGTKIATRELPACAPARRRAGAAASPGRRDQPHADITRTSLMARTFGASCSGSPGPAGPGAAHRRPRRLEAVHRGGLLRSITRAPCRRASR
jgi:hypothetical protein